MSGLAALRAELDRLASELDPFVKTRGRPLVRAVPEALLPDPATGTIACDLEPGGAKARASLALRGGRLVAGCGCPSFVAQGQCRHVAALVLALHERLGRASRLAPAHPHALPRSAETLAWRVRLPARGLAVAP